MTIGSPGAGRSVVEALRDAIVDGEFAPNQRLVEADLSERFGASRGSIRTALLELGAEGLVERVQNRGARVRAVSLAEAIEITEVRMVLEGLCAAKAAGTSPSCLPQMNSAGGSSLASRVQNPFDPCGSSR